MGKTAWTSWKIVTSQSCAVAVKFISEVTACSLSPVKGPFCMGETNQMFFPDLGFQLFTVFMLSVIYSMLEMSDIELYYKTKKPTNAFPKKPNYCPVFPQYHETHLSFIQHLSSQIKIIIIIIKNISHRKTLKPLSDTLSFSVISCNLFASCLNKHSSHFSIILLSGIQYSGNIHNRAI